MYKKDRKIGDIFEDGDVLLSVEENKNCLGCYYNKISCFSNSECIWMFRKDKTQVIFREIEKPKSKTKKFGGWIFALVVMSCIIVYHLLVN